MRRRAGFGATLAALVGAAPTIADAHAFGAPYVLPVPFWMYACGCAATLIATFAILAVFLRHSAPPVPRRGPPVHRLPPALLLLLRGGAGACLILTVVAGFAGADDPDGNIAMTMFWILFLLGFAWLTLFTGDLYALVNPWRTAIDILERCGLDLSAARVDYPAWLGSWPAFLLYVALICLELFTAGTPALLARALTLYSLFALAGALLLGKRVYFSKVDLFGVYFRTIGTLAPIAYGRSADGGWTVRLRPPLLGALEEAPADAGLVLFVLFMLSSTAYDGIHDTQLWTGLFWRTSLPVFLPLWGGDLGRAQDVLMRGFRVYRWAGLLVFPLLYLAIYLAALGVGRLLTRAVPPPCKAMYVFCNSLIPIGVGYNVAHYFAFFVTQTRMLPSILSDPLGLGWTLLGPGTATPPSPLSMGLIWPVEVGAILTGHVVSVCLAHLAALRHLGQGRGAVLGQLSLLALMVVYTIFGLWILSLPLG